MKYTEVKNLVWANADHTMFSCDVNFNHIKEEFTPFGAKADDPEKHGRDIFAAAVEGKFGVIQEYQQQILSPEGQSMMARQKRDALLVSMDLVVSNPLRWQEFTLAQQEKWILYRRVLLDVPQQVGFPDSITWPEAPNGS